MNDVHAWFLPWLRRHQAWNPHRWEAFEGPGPVVYAPWVKAFRARSVTEAEADAASMALAEGESAFPEHHLPRLLGIIASGRAARAAEVGRAKPILTDEEAEADQAAHDEARARWQDLPEAEKESRRASALEQFPEFAALPRMIERVAIDEWRGHPFRRFEPKPAPPVAIPSTPPSPLAEAPLTPGQRAMLAHLPRWAQVRFETFSPARRRGILAPYGHGFDRVRLAATITDISDGEGTPKIPAGPAGAEDQVPAPEVDSAGPLAQVAAIEDRRADEFAEAGESGGPTPHGPRVEAPMAEGEASAARLRHVSALAGRAREGTPRAGKSRRSGPRRGRAPPAWRRGMSAASSTDRGPHPTDLMTARQQPLTARDVVRQSGPVGPQPAGEDRWHL